MATFGDFVLSKGKQEHTVRFSYIYMYICFLVGWLQIISFEMFKSSVEMVEL